MGESTARWGEHIEGIMADSLRVRPKAPKVPALNTQVLVDAMRRMQEAMGGATLAVARAAQSMALFGLQVHVSEALPTEPPTPGEDAERIVRHGMADVLKWLGEEPGPKPGEVTHAVIGEGVLVCSREFYYSLRREQDPYDGRIPNCAPSLRLISDARRRSQMDFGGPANIDLPVDAL